MPLSSPPSWWCAALASVAAFVLTCAQVDGPAIAQGTRGASAPAITYGDAAVSSFSGTELSTPALEPGIDPVDKTTIDLDGATLRIFDLTTIGGPPAGQIVNAPVKLEVKAREIGQVFGLAFDDGVPGSSPNLYAAATSTFGIQIVGGTSDAEGKPIRLKIGAIGAHFMDGQFGSGGGPGSIWKIDGATGTITLFADVATAGMPNSGPGLGGLAFDAHSRSLYASDLDSGLILRFAIASPASRIDTFDHGTAGRSAQGLEPIADDGQRMEIEKTSFRTDDTSTWGFTQPERRVHGLAVHRGRLYYAVSQDPEIWSVGLNPDGSFSEDARIETAVRTDRPAAVTKIIFDGQGRMTIALRGATRNPFDYSTFVEPEAGSVVRFLPAPSNASGRWIAEPQSYAIGAPGDGRSATGGATLGYSYRSDGWADVGACEGTLLATGDRLTGSGGLIVAGLQITGAELDRPAIASQQSSFVSIMTQQDPDVRGHVGDVEMLRRCEGQPAQPMTIGAAPLGWPQPSAEPFPPIGELPPHQPPFVPGIPPPPVGVDPQAPNLAVNKTQSCRLTGGDTAECDYTIAVTNAGAEPFEFSGGTIADSLSVVPASLTGNVLAFSDKTVNGFRTKPGASSNIIAPGQTQGPFPFKATFNVPPGGLTVENCVSLEFAAAGTSVMPPFTPVDALPDPPDLPASTSNGLDRAISIVGHPQCTARGNVRDCSWTVTLSNPGTVPADLSFNFTTSLPATDIGGPGGLAVSRVNDTTTVFAGGTIPPKAVRQRTIRATFPLGTGSVSATASVAHPGIKDINPGNDQATAAAGAAPPEVIPMDEVSADANPADNTSCVKWDSTRPTDQGQPSNAPTQPPLPGLPPPGQTKAGPLEIAKRAISKTCDPVTGTGCDFEITITNTSTTPFTGPIEFQETITGDGGFLGSTAVKNGPTPPWSCAKAGLMFTCTHPDLTLAPGGKSTVLVGFALGAGSGAVKTVKNCAQLKGAGTAACAEINRDQPGGQPSPPPAQVGQLQISKSALVTTCTDVGGGCDFEVTVRNTGISDAAGPIEIDDKVTVNGGAIATTQLTAVPNQPWTCLHKGQGGFSCTHPGPIKAGDTAKVKLSVRLGTGTANDHIRNCATLKDTNKEACAEILLSKGLQPKLRATKQLIGACNPTCNFSIVVTNVGTQHYKGPISIVDSLKPQVPAQFALTSGNVTCKQAAPAFFVCDNPSVDLAPGTSMAIRLQVTVTQMSFEGQNCVAVSGKPNGVGDNEQPSRCVPFSMERRQPNLAVSKRALSQTCALKGPPCPFGVWISNTGNETYTGKLTIFDTVFSGEGAGRFPSGVFFRIDSPEWTCTQSTEERTLIRCDRPNVTLTPGSNTSLGMGLTPGTGWSKNNIMQNCAELARDAAGNDPGTIKSDNASCASIRLDPFALTINKTGNQSCQPGGECSFDLEIFNPGPILHDDPVTILDGLSGLSSAPILSITPASGSKPFPCAQAPTQIPFQCSGHMRLEIGERHKYTMTIRLPEGPSGGAFSNCAILSGPQATPSSSAGGPGTTRASTTAPPDDSSAASDCHTVRLEPRATTQQQPSPPQSCFGRMVLTRAGTCACPVGTKWSGRRCLASVVSPSVPGRDPVRPPPVQSGPVPIPIPLPAGGFDTSKGPTSEKRPECPRGQLWDNGRCICPRGQDFVRGACRNIPQEQVACPRGTIGTYPNCRCPPGMTGEPPTCCPPGTHYANGRCERPPPPPKPCPRGSVGTRPNCQCRPGQQWTGARCVPAPKPQVCTGGMVGRPPNCACPSGTRYVGRYRRCVPSSKGPTSVPPPAPTPTPQKLNRRCPPGTFGRWPRCRPRTPATCPPGTYGKPPNCTKLG